MENSYNNGSFQTIQGEDSFNQLSAQYNEDGVPLLIGVYDFSSSNSTLKQYPQFEKSNSEYLKTKKTRLIKINSKVKANKNLISKLKKAKILPSAYGYLVYDTLRHTNQTRYTMQKIKTADELKNIAKQYLFDVQPCENLKNEDVYAVLITSTYNLRDDEIGGHLREDATRMETLLYNSGVPLDNIVKITNDIDGVEKVNTSLKEGCKHNMLIFMYSGCGKDGFMTLANGTYYSSTMLWDNIKDAKNSVFCMFNCRCSGKFPQSIINNITIAKATGTKIGVQSILSWASQSDEQDVVVTKTNRGYVFLGDFVENYDVNKTWDAIWQSISSEKTYDYTITLENNEEKEVTCTHTPYKLVSLYHKDFSDCKVFTCYPLQEDPKTPTTEDDIKLLNLRPSSKGYGTIGTNTKTSYVTFPYVDYEWGYFMEENTQEYSKFSQDDNYGQWSNIIGWQKSAHEGMSMFFPGTWLNRLSGINQSFEKLLEQHEKTQRPMLLIYGNPDNMATRCFNAAVMVRSEQFKTFLKNFTDIETESKTINGNYKTKIIQSVSGEEGLPAYKCGFYVCYYIDDGNDEESNKVKSYISQYFNDYDSITTGYPWYMIRGYKRNGDIYVRYGSLCSQDIEGTVEQTKSTYKIGGTELDLEAIIETQLDTLYNCGLTIGYVNSEKTKVYYSVTFNDYDGKVLKNAQKVLKGSSAIPPEDPIREGYTFQKWIPSYENVNSDITCVANYQKNQGKKETVRIIPVDKFGESTTTFSYQDEEYHQLVLSYNVTGGVLASQKNNGLKKQLCGFYSVGANVFNLEPYCFDNCVLITKINLYGTRVRQIGEYCFQNCTNLELLRMPYELTYVSDGVIKGCDKLKSIQLPVTNITNVSQNALIGSSVEKITFSKLKYDDIEKYCTQIRIQFLKNSDNATGDMADIIVTFGTKWTCPQCIFERDGYVFDDAFNSSPNGDGDQYFPDVEYECPKTILTLYAKWRVRKTMLILETCMNSSYGDLLDKCAEQPRNMLKIIQDSYGANFYKDVECHILLDRKNITVEGYENETPTKDHILELFSEGVTNLKYDMVILYLADHGSSNGSIGVKGGILHGYEIAERIKAGNKKTRIMIINDSCSAEAFSPFKMTFGTIVNITTNNEQTSDSDGGKSFIDDIFNSLEQKNNNTILFGSSNEENDDPILLGWYTCEGNRLGWMNGNIGMRFTNRIISKYNNFEGEKTYENIFGEISSMAYRYKYVNDDAIEQFFDKYVSLDETANPPYYIAHHIKRNYHDNFDEQKQIFT